MCFLLNQLRCSLGQSLADVIKHKCNIMGVMMGGVCVLGLKGGGSSKHFTTRCFFSKKLTSKTKKSHLKIAAMS